MLPGTSGVPYTRACLDERHATTPTLTVFHVCIGSEWSGSRAWSPMRRGDRRARTAWALKLESTATATNRGSSLYIYTPKCHAAIYGHFSYDRLPRYSLHLNWKTFNFFILSLTTRSIQNLYTNIVKFKLFFKNFY